MGSGGTKVPKHLNEIFKVKAVQAGEDKSVGLEINPVAMTIHKIYPDRTELSQVQIGDQIIAVDGTSIVDADDYRRCSHNKATFVITMGRAVNGSHKEKKDNRGILAVGDD